ncbi:MAG: calcium/sodium antiporter [Clostridia bacterium]|nr:calcium/sodium antiporter [Clostridia bacterium]
MLVPVLLFALGLVLLIKGGDWFVDGSVSLAHRFHLPELLIGATIVSIGTTLPEVMVSVQAALQNNSGISYGNAIGSVICNTSLIAAITLVFRPSLVKRRSLLMPVISFFVAAAFYALIAYTTGTFQRWHGFVLLGMFCLYMVLTVLQMKKHPEMQDEAEDDGDKEEDSKPTPLYLDLLMLVGGAAAIAIGANLLVENGTLIAAALGVPDSVIGLTMIALGTSLPELVTAITSLLKGHGSLSLGNVIGANLFNLVLVSGAAISIAPFSVPSERILLGQRASLVVDLPVMLLVMLLLCLPAVMREKLYRWQGILLLCIYVGFTIFQFAA